MNKKLLAGVLAVVFVAGVVTGCGNQATENTTPNASQETDATSGTDAVDATVASDSVYVNGTETIADSRTGREYNVMDYVTLCDYNNIVLEVDAINITDEDVDTYLDSLLSYGAEYTPTDKKTVENGDYVNIDYCGKKDGVAFDGGTAAGYVLGIGTGTFIPGFEDGLIGVNVGDTVDLNLTFPENYGSADLAGASVVFTVTVNSIVESTARTHETIDDAYVAANLEFNTVEELRQNTREYMEQRMESQMDTTKRNKLIEYLTTNCTVALPDGFVDGKATEYITQFENQLKLKENISLEDYLSTNYKMTVDDFTDDVKKNMVEDVKTELIFEAIATEKNDTLDVAEYNAYIADCLESTGLDSEQELYDIYTTDITNGQKYLMSRYFIQKTLDALFDSVEFVVK